VNKPKGPLIALIAIVGIAAGLTLHQLFAHRVTVTAADGSAVVIETDPRRLAPVGASGETDSIQRGGIEPGAKDRKELPEGTGREANLAGTKVR
jgi:hypothetical protein